jgi:murein endopeptidase
MPLPAEGDHHFTWSFVDQDEPNPRWRRWGACHTVRTTLRVIREFALANPGAPRLGVGDLSRRGGGEFGRRFGGLGHASHQNGQDVDVYYPRLDRAELEPRTVAQVDRRLSQDLVDRFVEAGAVYVFVGRGVCLRGPRPRVDCIPNHDNHMHVRFPRR